MTLFGSQILEDLEATHLCQGGEDMSRYVKICQDMSRYVKMLLYFSLV